MNTGRPVKDFAEEMIRQAKSKVDFITPTPTLQMLLDNGAVSGPANLAAAIRNTEGTSRPPVNFHMKFGDHGPFPLRNLTHDQLAEFVKIPKPYYDRMRQQAPALLVENLHTWLRHPEFQGKSRLVRVLDNHVRAFLSDRYRPLDNVDLFKAIIGPITEAGATIDSCELTETRLYIKCTTHKITFQPKLGDIIEAGIMVQNSEVGMGRLVVGPFLKRLACMNGMTVDDFAEKRTHIGKRMGRRGADLSGDMAVGGASGSTAIPEEWFRDETRIADDKAFFMKVQDIVRASFDKDKFAEIAERITGSTKRDIDANPVAVVKVLKNDFTLTDDEETSVLKHLINGGDLTQWGLANAVTRLAGDVADYDRATELERAGGQVVQLADTDWDQLLRDAKKAA